jgi:hypothetical protein
MARLRDSTISLLFLAAIRRLASRLRRFDQHPDDAIDLVLLPPATGAYALRTSGQDLDGPESRGYCQALHQCTVG